jgi:hypothetical protein
MDNVAQVSTPVKVRYNPHDFPLPDPRPFDEITARLMLSVASSGLGPNERSYLLFVLARIDPETWQGLFEFHHLKAALGLTHRACQGVQAALYRAGIVTWQRREGSPAPLTLHLHALINLPPFQQEWAQVPKDKLLKSPPDYTVHWIV